MHTFESQLWLPARREDVFAFFADAHQLESITPPWLRFRVLTPRPIRMAAGTLIDYSLRLRGLPLRWQTRIAVWQPPVRFVDEQLRGPYRLWRHEHTFADQNGGTLVQDRVEYAPPLSWLVHRALVRPDIERIFAFRRERLGEFFSAMSKCAT